MTQPLSLPEIAPLLTAAEMLALETLPPMAVAEWAQRAGKDPATVKEWAAAGLIRLENIHGHSYVPASETVRFNRRVARGEFKRTVQPVTQGPGRRKRL